jgi:phage terminase large subunit GpA-like protein
MTPAVAKLVTEVRATLRPPKKLSLSEWAEANFVLASGSSARPGRFRLWEFQKQILDVIGDSSTERIIVQKSTRVGLTKSLVAAICATAATDPCSIILLLPTDDDARGISVDEIEPAFDQSPALKGLLGTGRTDGRNTLTVKTLAGGGSLKILAARSPRNLRRHDAKKLFVDEADGCEVTSEGDPISLATKRTMAHPDRKICIGSTPTMEATSVIHRLYLESDQRIFEIPCVHCGAFFELLWPHLVWPSDDPTNVAAACPHCGALIDEHHKTSMVAAGRWRATQPHVIGVAGFRINALISPLANARWPKLVDEFLRAKRSGPAELMVHVNTIEGRVWTESIDIVEPEGLQARVEPFGLAKRGEFPKDVLVVCAGVDTQPDRFEVVLWGWSETQAFALGHFVVWGSPNDVTTQNELDALLRTQWTHPNGWLIGIEAVAIDSAGANTSSVYNFVEPRFYKKVYAIIGRGGPRRIWEFSKRKEHRTRLAVVGIDQVKTDLFQRLPLPAFNEQKQPTPGAVRFSHDLGEEFFDQIVGERRVVKYVRNRAVVEFRGRKAGQRVEVLDATVYCWAVRSTLRINFKERAARIGAVRAVDVETRARRLAEMLPH